MRQEATDDKNCGTCTDFSDWFNKKTNESKQAGENSSINKSSENRSENTKAAAAATTADPSEKYYAECPLFRNQLGRATWSYLHTMAAYYPSNPSEEMQRRMTDFIETFSLTFPCAHCAHGFQKE